MARSTLYLAMLGLHNMGFRAWGNSVNAGRLDRAAMIGDRSNRKIAKCNRVLPPSAMMILWLCRRGELAEPARAHQTWRVISKTQRRGC
jgi:hypothetical protein